MKKKVKINFKALSVISVLASVLGVVMYNAARSSWVFIDITVKLEGFTFYLLYVMVINAVIAGILAVLNLYEVKTKGKLVSQGKGFKAASFISLALGILFFIVGLIFTVSMLTGESDGVYMLYFKKSLYDALFFILVTFLALFLPLFKGKARNTVVAAVLIIVAAIGVCKVFPVGSHKITSEPVVVDTGKNYSVVFSTNRFGTGYVEYTYKGKEYKLFDNSSGRLNSDSKIHSVAVPYEHLDNNTYKIGSVRVIEQYSYGSRLGKEAVSGEYSFTSVKGEELTYLVVSDWHTELERAYKAVAHTGDYDAVLLLGDSSPGVDFEEEAVRNIVEFAGKLTEGKMPVIYTRGNHETRGEYAGKLADALGLDEFYYTVDTDSHSFIVLDSGEDKDDSHPEYGQMTDYNTYRANMVEWLKGVKVKNDKVIVLSHAWAISEVEEDLSETAWNEIDRLGARLILSGHTHACRLLGESESEKAMLAAHPDIVGYMDGGKRDDDYIASKMILSKDRIFLEAYNSFGEKVFEHSMDW